MRDKIIIIKNCAFFVQEGKSKRKFSQNNKNKKKRLKDQTTKKKNKNLNNYKRKERGMIKRQVKIACQVIWSGENMIIMRGDANLCDYRN